MCLKSECFHICFLHNFPYTIHIFFSNSLSSTYVFTLRQQNFSQTQFTSSHHLSLSLSLSLSLTHTHTHTHTIMHCVIYFGAATLGIMKFSITTLNVTKNSDTQHNDTQYCYVECRGASIFIKILS